MADCTIQFENVSLSLNARKLLNGVSLDIQEQRVGVIGRNGSGKTSFCTPALWPVGPFIRAGTRQRE